MARFFIIGGSLLAGLGVLMGAVAAHALKYVLSETVMTIFQTAVLYHLMHALGLLCIGMLARNTSLATGWLRAAGWTMLAGLLLFSGSLYVFALLDVKYITVLTPFGGTALICSWFLLAFAVWREGK